MKTMNDCLKPDKVDPINLFVTGGAGAGAGKSNLSYRLGYLCTHFDNKT